MEDVFVDPVKIGELQRGSLEERIDCIKRSIPDEERLVATHENIVYVIDESGDVYKRPYEVRGDEVRIGGLEESDKRIKVSRKEAGLSIQERLHRTMSLVQSGETTKGAKIMSSFYQLRKEGANEWAADQIIEDLREDWGSGIEVDPEVELESSSVKSDMSGGQLNEADYRRDIRLIKKDVRKIEDDSLERFEKICDEALTCLAETPEQRLKELHDEIADKWHQILNEAKVGL
jgi:hypothetical protein